MPNRKDKVTAQAAHLLDVYRALRARFAILEPLLFDQELVKRVGAGRRAQGLNIMRGALVAITEYQLTTDRTFENYSIVLVSRARDTFIMRNGEWLLTNHVETWIVHPPAIIALDSVTLAPFVGRYQHGPRYIDDVHFRGAHLVAQSTLEALVGAPGATLLSVSENTFSPDGTAPIIVFERDPRGRVTGYVQQQPDGTVIRARRLHDR